MRRRLISRACSSGEGEASLLLSESGSPLSGLTTAVWSEMMGDSSSNGSRAAWLLEGDPSCGAGADSGASRSTTFLGGSQRRLRRFFSALFHVSSEKAREHYSPPLGLLQTTPFARFRISKSAHKWVEVSRHAVRHKWTYVE